MDILALRGETPSVEVVARYHELKESLLRDAGAVTQVKNVFDQEIAAEALAELNQLIRQAEDARKTVKSPVLELSRAIDGAAKSYVLELKAEAKRVSGLLSAFMQAERVKAQQAQRRAEEEARKIQMEADLKRQKAMEEAKVTGKFIEADEAIERETAEKLRDVAQNQVTAAVPTPEGVSLRVNWKYEVTDIAALFAARPELVVMEPNKGAINALVKSGGVRELPGVRIYSEATTVT